MSRLIPARTRQRGRAKARKCTVESEIDSNIRSGFSWVSFLAMFCVISLLIVLNRNSHTSRVYQTNPVVVNTMPEPTPTKSMFRSAGSAVPNKKVVEILAWIKTEKPEWDTAREKLTIFLATQKYIDDWLLDEYNARKRKGLHVPEHFKEPGTANAFFTVRDGRSYMYLPWDFNVIKIDDEGTLVHELWHYAQRRNDVGEECHEEHEFGAYFHTAVYYLDVKRISATSRPVRWNIEKASEHVCDPS